MGAVSSLIFLILLILIIDSYLWSGIKSQIPLHKSKWRTIIGITFWTFTAITILVAIATLMSPTGLFSSEVRRVFMLLIALPLGSKLLSALFMLIDDARRGIQWLINFLNKPKESAIVNTNAPTIPRSEFITKTALIAGGGLAGTFAYGIISGAHDYRVHRIKVPLKNLPASFHGLKIAQLSDIHSGSFFNKTAVKGGIEMLLNEKPDLAVFTGDLVNDRTKELNEYYDIFKQVKAPIGTFSILGNHDYGEYYKWPNEEAKRKNLADMYKAHQLLGWNLMNDVHQEIKVGNESIALLGIQNWGGGRFPKYGNLAKAYENTDNIPVKILLSHDPSHWDLQVRPEFSDIDLMLAGHTHGMQFGIEIPGFRWSPSQYNYKRWAGLYQEKDQFLYVNRGFGYLGYPGRVGILPEITILELVKA